MSDNPNSFTGVINCGDWIYPNHESTSGVQYGINLPLVLMLYHQQKEGEQREISKKSHIEHHLNGPRYITVEITSNQLTICALHNASEIDFKRDINWSCKYDAKSLDRLDHVIHDFDIDDLLDLDLDIETDGHDDDQELFSKISKKTADNQLSLSILVTSILLQHYTTTKDSEFPEGISFRFATIPEIESLGKW